MNRYLLAALYVMAGCAVTIPLKAQTGAELLRMDGCRVMIVNTVKVVSACLEEDERKSKDNYRNRFPLPDDILWGPVFHDCGDFHPLSGMLCRTSCKIRAPGFILMNR